METQFQATHDLAVRLAREAGGEVYRVPDPALDCVIAGHPATVAALRELLDL